MHSTNMILRSITSIKNFDWILREKRAITAPENPALQQEFWSRDVSSVKNKELLVFNIGSLKNV